MLLAKVPFILHALTETAAARSFILQPQSQLPGASQEAGLILKNLGGALLATNLVCLAFVLRPDAEFPDRTTGNVALSLASYHLWPAYRACVRLAAARGERVRGNGNGGGQDAVMGGPDVHLAVHLVCLVGLVWTGLFTARGG